MQKAFLPILRRLNRHGHSNSNNVTTIIFYQILFPIQRPGCKEVSKTLIKMELLTLTEYGEIIRTMTPDKQVPERGAVSGEDARINYRTRFEIDE